MQQTAHRKQKLENDGGLGGGYLLQCFWGHRMNTNRETGVKFMSPVSLPNLRFPENHLIRVCVCVWWELMFVLLYTHAYVPWVQLQLVCTYEWFIWLRRSGSMVYGPQPYPTLSVKRNLSLLQSEIHWNPLHQNDSYLDTY